MRSGAFDATHVTELLNQHTHAIRDLIHAHSIGPQGRLSRARLTASGVVRPADPEKMWLYTTGAPAKVLAFLERSSDGKDPWVLRAHEHIKIRWEELKGSQVPER